MKYPAALVVAVLVWSTARYLPPYYLELRKLDLEESKVEVENAKSLAILRVMNGNAAPNTAKTQAPTGETAPERFY
jgi:hypothetical protein